MPRQNIVELVNEIEIMGMGDIDTNKILRIHMFKIYGDCMYVSLEKFHGFFKSLVEMQKTNALTKNEQSLHQYLSLGGHQLVMKLLR